MHFTICFTHIAGVFFYNKIQLKMQLYVFNVSENMTIKTSNISQDSKSQ